MMIVKAPISLDIEFPNKALAHNLPIDGCSKTKDPQNQFVHKNGIWFAAHSNAFSGDRIWHSKCGTINAGPVKPNTQAVHIENDIGLPFSAQENGGYVIERPLRLGNQFSMAVLFQSQGEAKTIVTVNPIDHKTYLFLSEKNNELTLSDDTGLMEPLHLPKNQEQVWVKIGYTLGRLTLAADEKSISSYDVRTEKLLATSFSGLNDVFLGCRSHRKGLAKTLGQFTLCHILLIPHCNLLRDESGQAELSELCAFVEQEIL